MARTNGPIQVWHRTDTIPTDAEGGYAGGDSTAAAVGTSLAQSGQAVATIDNLSATATALPAGASPTVTVTGAIPNKVINIGVPRGADGAPGMGYEEGQQLLAQNQTTLDAAQAAQTSAAQSAADSQTALQAQFMTQDEGVASLIDTAAGPQTRAAGDDRWAVGRLIRATDRERIAALLRSGEGIRYAALGDSTEAGVGHPGAGVYGEAQQFARFGTPVVLALGMIRADPNFVEPDPAVYPVTAPDGTSPVPRHNLSKSSNPTLVYSVAQATPAPLDSLTIYYLERTADTAPVFDVTVGATTHTVDTYVPPLTYGGTTTNVLPRLASATIPCPATAQVTWTIGNLRMVDRGDGAAANGSVYLLGATRGPGVSFSNLAVSSTTLENESPANVSRGVTTTERISKAVAMGANVVSMGWGSNDSKAGGLSPQDFRAEYANRIDQLRSALPGVTIILNTDPEGAGDYAANIAYNTQVRRVAVDKGVSCFDVERVIGSANRSAWIADDVHPSPAGYQALGQAVCSSLGVAAPFAPVKPSGAKVTAQSTAPQAANIGAPGDLVSRIDNGIPTLYQKRTTGNEWHIIAGGRTLTATNGLTPNRDSTTIVRTTVTTTATISNPSGGYEGDRLTVYVTQGGSGAVIWGAQFTFGDGGVTPSLSSAVGAVDRFEFEYDSAADKWREVARTVGMPS